LILFWVKTGGKRVYTTSSSLGYGGGAAIAFKHPYRERVVIHEDYREALKLMNEYYDSGEK
jgi:hypothetical protein